MFPLIGLIIGLIIGLVLDIDISSAYSSYVVTGFLGNSMIAVALAALGDQLNLQLSLAAVFAFGNRIFINFSVIRRILLERWDNRKQKPETVEPGE
jgi:small basic protein